MKYPVGVRSFLIIASIALPENPAWSAGQSALDFLRLDVGPREVGMGGVGAAVGGDAYSWSYNPALGAWQGASEVAFSQVSWIQDASYQDVLFSAPTRAGSFSFRFQHLSYGAIDGYDASGGPTGSLPASDLLAGAGYAAALTRELAVGGSAKFARETIGSAGVQSFLADLGAAYKLLRPIGPADVAFGASLRNLGSPVGVDGASYSAPGELVVGAAARFLSDTLVIGVDQHKPFSEPSHTNFGAELWCQPSLALRMGYQLPLDEGPGFSAGIGLEYKSARFDYGFFPLSRLGQTHHIGLSWRFGGPDEQLYQEGLKLYKEGKYAQAIVKFNDALKINPRHEGAVRKLRRAFQLLEKEDADDAGQPAGQFQK